MPFLAAARLLHAALLRDRLVPLALLLLLTLAGLGAFLAGTSVTEPPATRLELIAGLLRLAASVALIAAVALATGRLVESGQLAWIATRPIGRGRLVLALAAGALPLTSATALLAGSLLLAAGAPLAPTGLWMASLAVELAILAAAALAFALTVSAAGALVATLALLALGRSLGALVALATLPGASGAALIDRATRLGLQGLGLVAPRFDLMTQAGWLTDQAPPDTGTLLLTLAHALAFAALLLALAAFDLRRRRF